MKPRVLVAAVMGLCVAVVNASAQTAEPSAEKLRLARDVVAASGGADRVTRMYDEMFTQIGSLVEQNADPKVQKFEGVLMGKMQAELSAMVPRMLDIMVKIYASDYTETELRGVLAWQQSDVAKSIARKSPVIMHEYLQQMGPALSLYIQHMKADVIEETCKAQSCSTQQRDMITALMDKAMPKPTS